MKVGKRIPTIPSFILFLIITSSVYKYMVHTLKRNGGKGDSNPGSLNCESDILPLSDYAPDVNNKHVNLPQRTSRKNEPFKVETTE